MERKLKIETVPTGVKIINYEQFVCPTWKYGRDNDESVYRCNVQYINADIIDK